MPWKIEKCVSAPRGGGWGESSTHGSRATPEYTYLNIPVSILFFTRSLFFFLWPIKKKNGGPSYMVATDRPLTQVDGNLYELFMTDSYILPEGIFLAALSCRPAALYTGHTTAVQLLLYSSIAAQIFVRTYERPKDDKSDCLCQWSRLHQSLTISCARRRKISNYLYFQYEIIKLNFFFRVFGYIYSFVRQDLQGCF